MLVFNIYIIKGGILMDELFDLTKFDFYKEDNRREVKSKEWFTNIFMGNLFGNGKYLWWCYYIRYKRTR